MAKRLSHTGPGKRYQPLGCFPVSATCDGAPAAQPAPGLEDAEMRGTALSLVIPTYPVAPGGAALVPGPAPLREVVGVLPNPPGA